VALTVIIAGTLCGLKNVCQISQWPDNERVKDFLARHFRLAVVFDKACKSASLNQCCLTALLKKSDNVTLKIK
jgi:hypothetical protein